MSARPFLPAALLLGGALAACATSAPPKAPASAFAVPADAAARADASVKALMEQGPFPGVAVAVAQNGKIIYSRGFGVADRATGAPVLPDTRFPIGSITKPMTCLSVLQLAAKGKIDIDAPVGRYLPDVPAPSRDVPLRNLMEHSSGILNYLQNPDFPYNKPVGLSRADMLGYFAAKPLRFTPGSQFDYSNSNTFLLGLTIEAVTGAGYDEYVRANVFRPFGMTSSDFGERPDRAKGYLTRAGAVRDGTPYDWLVPFSAGAVVSNTTDLIRFADGLFGAATPDSIRAAALSGDRLADGSPNIYLKGCLIEGELDGVRKYSHAGSIYGFSSHLARYPDKGLTVTVLTNAQGENFPALTIEQAVARAFLNLPEPDQRPTAFDAAEAEWIGGSYVITNRRMGFDKLFIFPSDGQLLLSYGPQGSGAPTIVLNRLGEGRYVSSKDPAQLFGFRRNADGSVDLALRYYEGAIPMRKAG
ncbi:beta-lactamase family protein [Sandaracinobacter neustonicus]|uniref:Beta-lactamase family protein n=1 Tax=Sandaracinobacter neustonicus TaxID=1715348 RepID=A0A501XL38_9SPHN|nr:serine hydrolase domain-containing protein [Sandaracinobacter neustonicus]TPE61371.1 beta-lactamase family protein [Sandaracinobacter neustonicus]